MNGAKSGEAFSFTFSLKPLKNINPSVLKIVCGKANNEAIRSAYSRNAPK